MTVIAFTKPTADNELPTSVTVAEYIQEDGSPVHPYPRGVARSTHDGRFVLLKGWGRGSYVLAVRTDAEVEDGSPLYRFVGKSWSRSRIAEVEQEAGAFVGEVGSSDLFTVELPGEAAPRVAQAVALRRAFRNKDGSLAERAPYWGADSQAYERAVDSIAEEFGLSSLAARALKNRVVEAEARRAEGLVPSYTHAGWNLVYTSPVPDTSSLVEQAHAEAVEYVLKSRADRAEWAATLRAQRRDLEAELVTSLNNELVAAQQRLQRAQELAVLAQHSVDDAAQQLLDTGSTVRFSSSRGAHTVAQELARIDADLEQVESATVPATVLQADWAAEVGESFAALAK